MLLQIFRLRLEHVIESLLVYQWDLTQHYFLIVLSFTFFKEYGQVYQESICILALKCRNTFCCVGDSWLEMFVKIIYVAELDLEKKISIAITLFLKAKSLLHRFKISEGN